MAINTGAVLRSMVAWFMPSQPKEFVSDDVPVQNSAIHKRSTRIVPQDEEEIHRTRKAGLDLMKYQGINRGY
jgi:hypothetical protein